MPDGANEPVTRDREPTWDSLKHVQLILCLRNIWSGIQRGGNGIVGQFDGIVKAIEEKSGT